MPQVALEKMYTQATIEKGTFDEDERTFVAWASKPVLDRDGEIIASDAWNVDNFKSNPVILWAHNYDLPPVAKAIWTKTQKNGLKFMPQFAPTERGVELFNLYRDGFLNTFSVGFIPKDFEEDEEETVEFMGWFGDIFEKPVLTYTDVELLEISCVSVPSCAVALVERMASGQIKNKSLVKAIRETASKAVIPFKKYDLDPEESEWEGPAERKEADTDDLLLMSTWYDAENPDAKSSYKLPHHRAEGHNTVWRGVAAAMVALLGGRGGVDIPDEDRRSTYGHLERHYREFDKPAPDFKHYTALDLKAMEQASTFEAVQTSAGEVLGGWEAIETEEKAPAERMREEGLGRAKDGIVPVTTQLWNEIMDIVAAKTSDAISPDSAQESGAPDSDIIVLSASQFDSLLKEQIQIREKERSLIGLSHKIAEASGKLRVMQGGKG